MDVKKEKDCFITHVGDQTYSPTVLNRKRLQSLDHDKRPSKRKKVYQQDIPKLSEDMAAIEWSGINT